MSHHTFSSCQTLSSLSCPNHGGQKEQYEYNTNGSCADILFADVHRSADAPGGSKTDVDEKTLVSQQEVRTVK